jgi:hypothetical protein
VKLKPAGAPAYRIAVRSLTNDWDSVYTITGVSVDTIVVPYGSNMSFDISAAAVDNKNVESQFSTEYTLSTGLVVLALSPDAPVAPPSEPDYYGIRLLQNKPNPFDEGTMITILSGTDVFADRTWVQISSLDGKVVQRIKVPLHKGVNEVLYDHGFGFTGTYIYSLFVDGLPVQSRIMVFLRR